MGSLKCTITLDKADGLTLVVEDESASTKQTIRLSKDSIVLQVEGGTGTSTITQGADSVTIKCKKFAVDADEVECRSRQASTYAAQTNLTLSGQKEAKCSGTTLSFEATGRLKAEASGVATLKGSIVNISAPQVSLG